MIVLKEMATERREREKIFFNSERIMKNKMNGLKRERVTKEKREA